MLKIIELLRPIWVIFLKWGAIIGGILFVLFKARQSGKESVKNESIKATIEGVKVRDEIETDMSGLNADDIKRLHDKWIKKN